MPGSEASGDANARAPGLHEVLIVRGFDRFAALLASTGIRAGTLPQVGVRPMGARRALPEMARPCASSRSQLPEFGRILVHLANGRTAHSYLQSAMQLLVFALAFVRLVPPSVASPSRAFAAQLVLVAAGIGVCLIGLKQYFDLVRLLEGECSERSAQFSERFEPDIVSSWILFAMMACMALFCVYYIVAAELDIRKF